MSVPTKCRLCGDTIEHEEHEDLELCHDCLHDGFQQLQLTLSKMDNIELDDES